jgi:hypothetical protein
MIDHGNVIDHCAAYLYWVMIEKKFMDEQTEAMKIGSMFEHKALGMPGRAPSVPRHATTGKPLIKTERALHQAEIFKSHVKQYQMQVVPELNTQVTIYKRWSKDPRWILKGILDLFPTPFLVNDKLELNIIDLKTTGNIMSTFGKFSWGHPESMDHIQAMLYYELVRDIDFELNDELQSGHYLRDIFTTEVQEAIKNDAYSFRYMIYDLSANLAHQIIKIECSPIRIQEMHESIRKVTNLLIDYNEAKWPTFPCGQCKNCPVTTCKDRLTEIII